MFQKRSIFIAMKLFTRIKVKKFAFSELYFQIKLNQSKKYSTIFTFLNKKGF